jgi:hypothetical protein
VLLKERGLLPPPPATPQYGRDTCFLSPEEFAKAREQAMKSGPENCEGCKFYADKFGPRHDGSTLCRSGSVASGGLSTHCTCDTCF